MFRSLARADTPKSLQNVNKRVLSVVHEMFLHTYFNRTRWYYIILLAILIQTLPLIFYLKGSTNTDADSAIERATTESCKKELRDVAAKLETFNRNQLYLKRYCQFDAKVQRNSKLGCASRDIQENLIKLEDQVTDLSECLELCFSYGHSHGGLNKFLEHCYCGGDITSINNKSKIYCNNELNFDWYRVNNGIYHHKMIVSPAPSSTDYDRVKIAFLLILKGRSVMQVERLLRNIYSDDHIYYIHVDKRDNYMFDELSFMERKHQNVLLAQTRFNTVWGGPSILRMIVGSIEYLSKFDWDYIINLSESDFPIKSLSSLEKYLSFRKKYIFLKAHNISGYNFIKKQGLDWNFYQCDDRVWRMGKRRLPKGIIYSGGSDWFALPRDFSTYVIDKLNDPQDNLVWPLFQLYNYTLLPAESFFHTVAMNSEFCGRIIDNNLKLTNWHHKKSCKCQHRDVVDWCGCSPLTYRWSDWDKLKRTKSHKSLFFSRKFDPTISSSIINEIEQQLLDHESIIGANDTRFWQSLFSIRSDRLEGNEAIVLKQFGELSLNQIGLNSTTGSLESVEAFFEQDRFVGILYNYCWGPKCRQFFVRKNLEAHLNSYDDNCLSMDGVELTALEVNHGFDTGERMFRNYNPMGTSSDMVVYHDWHVGLSGRSPKKNSTGRLQFHWINPLSDIEFIQDVRLKPMTKPTRLSLVHRLNMLKPVLAGLWTLKITYRGSNCLNYRFLVFDQSSGVASKIDQRLFDQFYSVLNSCTTQNADNGENLCSMSKWSRLSSVNNQ